MNERVVNIPERLILDKELGEMRALVYAGLVFTKWSPNRNIGELVTFCGYTPCTGDGKINSKFRDIVSRMISSGYFTSDFKQIDCGECATIYFDEFAEIIRHKKNVSNRTPQDRCFLLLTYIRYMVSMCYEQSVKFFASTPKDIAEFIGLPTQYVSGYADILNELKLVLCELESGITDIYGRKYYRLLFFVEATSRTNPNYDPRAALEKAKHNFINRW